MAGQRIVVHHPRPEQPGGSWRLELPLKGWPVRTEPEQKDQRRNAPGSPPEWAGDADVSGGGIEGAGRGQVVWARPDAAVVAAPEASGTACVKGEGRGGRRKTRREGHLNWGGEGDW